MERPPGSTDRLEAFSDGIFAVAATLLVLNLSVGTTPAGHLGHDLLSKWPHYATYVVSFLTIGIIWINHHRQFEHIARADRTLMLLNLVLLMFVTLIPFPTSLLAQYLGKPADAEVAAIAYAASLLAMGVAFFATYAYATHAQLFASRITAEDVRHGRRRNLRGLAVYVVAIGMAFVSPPACLALCGLDAVYFALPGRQIAK